MKEEVQKILDEVEKIAFADSVLKLYLKLVALNLETSEMNDALNKLCLIATSKVGNSALISDVLHLNNEAQIIKALNIAISRGLLGNIENIE